MSSHVDEVAAAAVRDSLASEVRHYLHQTPRQLPSRALYDALGSRLFEAICELPWYSVSRAERRLIAAHRHEIFSEAGWPQRLVELGGGNGQKLDLLLGRGPEADHDTVQRIDLIDVSASALADAARRVSVGRTASIVTHQSTYERGLATMAASRGAGERALVLFLGSNIGNFDPAGAHTFLAQMRSCLQSGDALLLGADLIKPERDLLLAYDDPLGVTAAFNKNLLIHLNRALGATFDVSRFDHRALWNARDSRIEMHLVSRQRQRIDLPQAGVSLELTARESIWTESSYKYSVDDVAALVQRAGFTPGPRWIEAEGQFLLMLALA